MTEPRYNLPVPLNFSQPSLLIEHSIDGEVVPQRPKDGYINATLLCQQAGKLFGGLQSTNADPSLSERTFRRYGNSHSGFSASQNGRERQARTRNLGSPSSGD